MSKKNHAVTFDGPAVERAIETLAPAQAKAAGRHVEWVRRRLYDAVRYVSENPPEARDYEAHHALARPVLELAAVRGGIIAGGPIN